MDRGLHCSGDVPLIYIWWKIMSRAELIAGLSIVAIGTIIIILILIYS